MEFTRLADVEVVETATDIDKVLIEQNGEIKRVPKTEVGGAGGNMIVADLTMDVNTGAIAGSTNMTLDEAVAAINNREATGVLVYLSTQGMGYALSASALDMSAYMGVPAVVLICAMGAETASILWDANGFAITA